MQTNTRSAAAGPSPALRALALVAGVLNARLAPAAAWQATHVPLSRAAREDGLLERITLWKVLEKDLEGADTSADDFNTDTAAVILEHLNWAYAEPEAAWYSDPLTKHHPPLVVPAGTAPYHAVIAKVSFWKLTDAAARERDLLH